MGAKRNKTAGSNHERDEVKRYRKYFHDVETTRLCNRARDNQGIDLCSENEEKNGRLPLDISCKSSIRPSVSYPTLFRKMAPGRIKVIHHRHTKKPELVKVKGGGTRPGKNFVTKGEYVIMESEGYEQFLQHVYAVQVLRALAPAAVKVLEDLYGLNLLNFTHQLPKTDGNNTTNDGSSE